MSVKGNRVEVVPNDIWEMFAPVEGYNAVYYGKVRNGKTRSATADIIELLKRGETVYANWKIDFPDYDERKDFGAVWKKVLFGRKYFFKYNIADNFHYIDPDELISGGGEVDIHYLGRLVGVHLFIDEGQWLFSSMDKTWDRDTIAKMKLVLHGGHYCRSLNIITQRASNISKNMRSQVNIWYRCVKRLDFGSFMVFQRWSIEDMKDDLPVEFIKDEDGKETPNGEVKNYFVNKLHDPVFKAYNTHAMRNKDAIPVLPAFELYSFSRWQRIKLLLSFFAPAFLQREREGQELPPATRGDGAK